MSRRTVLFRKKFGSSWTSRGGKGGMRTHQSGNGGSLDGLLPSARVRGKGTYLKDRDRNGSWTDNGTRGVGSIVTEAMNPEKMERIKKAVEGGGKHRRR